VNLLDSNTNNGEYVLGFFTGILFLSFLIGSMVLFLKLLGFFVDKGYISSEIYGATKKQSAFSFVFMIGYFVLIPIIVLVVAETW
jgi:hypothetical protein